MEPQLVVVLVSKNNPQDVKRTLASLFTLNSGHARILVIDSSDSDQVKTLVKNTIQGPPKNYVWTPPSGIYPAMNEALRHIEEPEYVMYLNPGDILLETKALSNLVISLGAQHKEWGFGRAIAHGKGSNTAFPLIGAEINQIAFLEGELRISHQAVIARKSSLIAIGGFQTSLQITADFNLIAKLIDKYKPVVIEEILISYDESGISHRRILRTYYESTIVRWNNSHINLMKSIQISVRNFILQRDFLKRKRRGHK